MSDGFARAQARMAALGAPKLAAWAGGARDDTPASTSAPSTASPAKLRPNVAFLGNTLRAITSANARLYGARKADPGAGVAKDELNTARAREPDARATTLAASGGLSGSDADGVVETCSKERNDANVGVDVDAGKRKRQRRTRGGVKKRKKKNS